ncbi:MAG TPA: histidine phosphatase family protein [Kineosporiaceae bacterium]|nr:histidine phosphatase family protein [Kineosporiaceae bacterium]
MSAQRVILLRHGRTAYNAEARFQGQLDVPLDEVGLGQAKRVADTLASELTGGPVRVLSSDLSRAAQTAEVVAARLGTEVTLEPRLREIYAGQWQGLLREEIVAGWPENYAAWRRGDVDVRIGGGESRADAGLRASAAITEAAGSMDGGTLICVSHGGSLRSAIFLLLGTPSFPWNALEGLRNAHWAELQQTSRGWRLSVWNIGSTSER